MICLERINSFDPGIMAEVRGVVGINGKDIMIEHRMGKIAVKDPGFGERKSAGRGECPGKSV